MLLIVVPPIDQLIPIAMHIYGEAGLVLQYLIGGKWKECCHMYHLLVKISRKGDAIKLLRLSI